MASTGPKGRTGSKKEPRRSKGHPGSVARARKARRIATRSRRGNAREGSTLDDFLLEEGSYEQATTAAVKETIAWQVSRAMQERALSKTEMARRMGTSRAALDRILDPENDSVTLNSLLRTASALGLELVIALREASS